MGRRNSGTTGRNEHELNAAKTWHVLTFSPNANGVGADAGKPLTTRTPMA